MRLHPSRLTSFPVELLVGVAQSPPSRNRKNAKKKTPSKNIEHPVNNHRRSTRLSSPILNATLVQVPVLSLSNRPVKCSSPGKARSPVDVPSDTTPFEVLNENPFHASTSGAEHLASVFPQPGPRDPKVKEMSEGSCKVRSSKVGFRERSKLLVVILESPHLKLDFSL